MLPIGLTEIIYQPGYISKFPSIFMYIYFLSIQLVLANLTDTL